MRNTLLYTISIFLFFTVSRISAQEKSSKDSIKTPQLHSLRVGVDISKPILGLFNTDYKALELVADYRLKNNIYLAGEFGTTTRSFDEVSFAYQTKGSYYKVGFDYNVYDNLIGMNNMIYTGLRYSHSTFSQELLHYDTNTIGNYWPNFSNTTATEYDNLNASWVSLVFGLKVETFKNVFVSSSLQLNRLVSQKEPNNFKNLYIPGFNRVGLNALNASFNYTIAYTIPLTKSTKEKSKTDE